MPFISEAHSNAVVAKGPNFLDQAIVELAAPFAGQEGFDRLATLKKLRTVSPATVGRIGERNPSRISRIPRILGQARLLCSGVGGEGGKRRSVHRCAIPRFVA